MSHKREKIVQLDFFKIKNFFLKDNEKIEYLQLIYTVKKFFLEYIKNLQNSMVSKPNLKVIKTRTLFQMLYTWHIIYEKSSTFT